jgi:hypothetical protein
MDKEFLYMQKLAGIITESEYNAKIEEIKQDKNFVNNLLNLEKLAHEYVAQYGKIKLNNE